MNSIGGADNRFETFDILVLSMDGDEVYDSLDESISDTSSDEAQEEFHGANELSGEESGKEEEDEEERDRGGNSLNIQFELSDNGSEKDVGETSSVDSNTKRRNRGGRSTPDNFVPLRERSNSDLERFKSRIATSEAAKEAQEMPEKWRKRLWPSNAVISFCRLILRCQPRLNGDDDNVTLRELISHWRTSDLQKLGCAFTSTSAHNSAFFLLVVEECRASFMCSNMDYSSEKYYRRSHRMQGEVHAIVTESEPGGLMQAKDPRLGSVWVVSTAIVHGQSIIGGDLLLLSSSQWDHPVLGIAQPWDPDYDIKFSNTLHFRSQRSVSGIATTDEADDRLIGDNLVDGRKFYVNIMVCVDRSKTVNAIGGWAPQGAIYPGVNLHISILGMTILRSKCSH